MEQVDFENTVIRRSKEVPVVVDFWADWCGPCKELGPIIESMAANSNGKWELVKVDTEQNPWVALDYKIRSIPAVKMFWQGQVIAEFVGAQPQSQIQRWLDSHLPDESKMRLDAIREQLATGDRDDALYELEMLVAVAPGLAEARAILALEIVNTDPGMAAGMVADIYPGQTGFEMAEDVRALARLHQFEREEPANVALKLRAAAKALAAQDEEAAIQFIIEATALDKSFEDDLPRKSGIALFRKWGLNHPFTRRFRRRFDMALY